LKLNAPMDFVHPTSFPGPYGIGDLGGLLVDFLQQTGQTLWQIHLTGQSKLAAGS